MRKNNGTVYIDSTRFDAVQFAFVPFDDSAETRSTVYELPKRTTQIALFLKKFLKSALGDDSARIAAFAVKVGEGSFAGIRSGIALALGMGFALGAPVYAIDAKGKTQLVTQATEINYGAAPNIGIAKKKKLKQIHH